MIRGTTQIAYLKICHLSGSNKPYAFTQQSREEPTHISYEMLSNLRLRSHRPLRTFVIGSQQPPTLWKRRHATLFVIAFRYLTVKMHYSIQKSFVNHFLWNYILLWRTGTLRGTIFVRIGKNAENGEGIEKSFSVFEWIFWDILFFWKKNYDIIFSRWSVFADGIWFWGGAWNASGSE